MLMDCRLKSFFLCCLFISIRPLNAKMDTIEMLLKSSDVQKESVATSSSQDATTDSYSESEAPVNVQNTSNQAAMQKTTNASLHGASGLSGLIRIPLSLSLDDVYYGCSHKMLIEVKHHYFPRSTGEGLHSMYTNLCAVKAMRNKDNYDPLSFNHFRALCAYMDGSYGELNRAVRRGKASYGTLFEFHALHFLLSDAIRLLKLNQRSCFTTYRRSKLLFSGEPGQTMRFGSFASSSLSKDLRQFGQRTCFEIRTYFGDYLKSYSEFDSNEDEVLIPPYEMFNIVSVDTSGQNHLHCDVVYKLETAGLYSSLNCQAVEPFRS